MWAKAPDFGNNTDVINYLLQERARLATPTPEELEKERRRHRTNSIIASLADAAGAISNIIATHNYAPNAFNERTQLAPRLQEQYDRILAQRQADRDRALAIEMKIAQLKTAAADRRQAQARAERADYIQQAKLEREQQEAQLDALLTSARISQVQYAAEKERIAAEYAEKWWAARLAEKESVKNKNDRRVPSQGRGSKGGSGKGKNLHPALDRYGNVHYFNSVSDANDFANSEGTYVNRTTKSTSSYSGREKETTRTGGYRQMPSPAGKGKKKSPTANGKKKSPTAK